MTGFRGARVLVPAELRAVTAWPIRDLGWWMFSWYRRRHGTHDAALAISPWGIVATTGGETRVIEWTDVLGVRTERIERSDRRGLDERYGAVATRVRVTVTDGTFVGAVPGEHPAVATLDEAAGVFGREAARDVALDLEGTITMSRPAWQAPAGSTGFQPVHAAARRMLESPEGAALLDLPWSGYRGGVRPVAGPSTVAKLLAALSTSGAAHRAPLVAVLAGELAATALSPALLELIMSPHSFVAATCKAAALRLGEARFRPGPVAEVRPFLNDAEISALESWAGDDAPAASVRWL